MDPLESQRGGGWGGDHVCTREREREIGERIDERESEWEGKRWGREKGKAH